MNFFGSNNNRQYTLFDLIEEHSIILDSNSNEYMCKFSSEIMNNYTEMWVYNRSLNEDKIKEIEKQLRNKTMLESILYLVYSKFHNKFTVFDGNHRRQALINRYRVTGINVSVVCFIYVIDEEFDTKEFHDKVYEKFKIINNNTPIPQLCYQILENTLYNDNHDELNLLNTKRSITDNLLLEFKKIYKPFYSLSANCYSPNFNDTKFYDLCDSVEFRTKQELMDCLNVINEYKKSQRNLGRLSDRNLQKCIKHDFYLFIK